MSVSGKESKIFLAFFSKYDLFFWGGGGRMEACVCILMIKTHKQLVLGKITWLIEIRAIYVKYQVLDLAVLLVKA